MSSFMLSHALVVIMNLDKLYKGTAIGQELGINAMVRAPLGFQMDGERRRISSEVRLNEMIILNLSKQQK